jgi:hypothetical protein
VTEYADQMLEAGLIFALQAPGKWTGVDTNVSKSVSAYLTREQ